MLQVPTDILLIYALGLVACALILWIGRLPKQEFETATEECVPKTNPRKGE